MSQHIWSPNWEKVPGSMSAPWVRLLLLQFGVPGYNPRTETGHHKSVRVNCSSGFMLMLLVLLCKTWNVVKALLARPLPQAQQSQHLSPI